VRARCCAAIAINLLATACAKAADPPARVVVAWTDVSNAGHIRSFPSAAPWAFDTPALNVGASAILREAGGLLYVVSRIDATVAVVDFESWTILRTLSVGAGREPVDIAVIAPDRAYVSCFDETHLLRFNPITGETTPVVDFSIFADADGIPELNMLAAHEDRLFVQLRRIDSMTHGFVQPAMLAVVDLKTEQLIDVDPIAPGVQAIELEGMAPKLKMQIVESSRRLYLSASGDFFDEGGIEAIDLDTLQTVGLILREADGEIGADLGAFILTTSERGLLTFSTDFAESSHMVEFTVSGGVVPGGALFETVGYFVPTLPHDPATNTIFFPNGGFGDPGVFVLDADAGDEIAAVTLDANTFPTDVVVILPPTNVPAVSTWGLVILALVLSVVGGVFIRRASRVTIRRTARSP
jgi:hypothetical protein